MLLDTNMIIWLLIKPKPLPQKTIDLVLAQQDLFYSSVSIWELGLLSNKHKLGLKIDFGLLKAGLDQFKLSEISLTGEMALRSTQLTNFHADPGDRFLVATALCLDLPLITSDRDILAWDGPLKTISAR